MTFKSCNRLIVSDLNLKDSQQIHVTVSQCAGVSVSRLSISARGDSPNTDGIHITRSTNVTISDTVVGTGDDCISIVSNSSFITARNIFCGPGHGIRYWKEKNFLRERIHKILSCALAASGAWDRMAGRTLSPTSWSTRRCWWELPTGSG